MYGEPYGDWSAMFCAFCLDHAHVENFPLETICRDWLRSLSDSGLYESAGTYTPKPGDLVFLDKDGDGAADGVGFVIELTDGRLETVEGDDSDCVKYDSYYTGGIGTYPVSAAGILLLAGALLYCCKTLRRRERRAG